MNFSLADRVIFRKFRKGGDIIAFMPDVPANRGLMMSYQHNGQHGEADYYLCLSITTPCKPGEYDDLLQELVNIGYGKDNTGQNIGIKILRRLPK
jgi:hypothetical protein